VADQPQQGVLAGFRQGHDGGQQVRLVGAGAAEGPEHRLALARRRGPERGGGLLPHGRTSKKRRPVSRRLPWLTLTQLSLTPRSALAFVCQPCWLYNSPCARIQSSNFRGDSARLVRKAGRSRRASCTSSAGSLARSSSTSGASSSPCALWLQ